MDIMDGVCVPDLLFGLDFIAALRRRTKKVLDVHLVWTNTDWIDRYAEAGSNLLTIHRQFCNDVSITLRQMYPFQGRSRGSGCRIRRSAFDRGPPS